MVGVTNDQKYTGAALGVMNKCNSFIFGLGSSSSRHDLFLLFSLLWAPEMTNVQSVLLLLDKQRSDPSRLYFSVNTNGRLGNENGYFVFTEG